MKSPLKHFRFRVSVPKVVIATGRTAKQARTKAFKSVLRGKSKPRGATAALLGKARRATRKKTHRRRR